MQVNFANRDKLPREQTNQPINPTRRTRLSQWSTNTASLEIQISLAGWPSTKSGRGRSKTLLAASHKWGSLRPSTGASSI